ncbi:MAG: hypothetical protein IPJ34_37335 [Myxococcales bacterium]|nr:hypothetical protein [Myxococcales bacterium]
MLALLIAGCLSVACSSSEVGPAAPADAAPDTDDASPADAKLEASLDADTGSDTPVDAPTGVPLAEYCKSYAEAYCAFYAKCAPLLLATLFADPSTCSARFALICSTGAPTATVYSRSDIDAQLACYASLTCDDRYQAKTCAPPRVVAARASGGSCAQAADCASRACSATETVCGTCASPVGTGASCGAPALCAYDAVCAGQCIAVVGLDEACDTTKVCTNGTLCKAGKCVKAGGVGAACKKGSDCDVLQDLDCNRTSGSCEKVTLVGAGEDCPWFTSGPPIKCGHGTRCQGPTGGTGKCVAVKADGEACAPSDQCAPGASCLAGKCGFASPLSCP